jgi:hypothetical protein
VKDCSRVTSTDFSCRKKGLYLIQKETEIPIKLAQLVSQHIWNTHGWWRVCVDYRNIPYKGDLNPNSHWNWAYDILSDKGAWVGFGVSQDSTLATVPRTNKKQSDSSCQKKGLYLMELENKSSNHRLSLNRSQCGGCSTEYNTLTSN